jgi:hypothetical protein
VVVREQTTTESKDPYRGTGASGIVVLVGILRLLNGFASRSHYFAQNDNEGDGDERTLSGVTDLVDTIPSSC